VGAYVKRLEYEKATKLRSPNFHVSRTRLLVHNIPKTMTEKELKRLFIEGVKSRASKQNPVIKQVRLSERMKGIIGCRRAPMYVNALFMKYVLDLQQDETMSTGDFFGLDMFTIFHVFDCRGVSATRTSLCSNLPYFSFTGEDSTG
jgi:hypothetical protein